MILDILVRAIRWEDEIKGIQIGKKEVKLSLLADDMIFYIKNPKKSTPKKQNKTKLLQLINDLGKAAGNNDINIQKSTVFLYSSNEKSKNEIKKNNSIYSGIKKRIK